MQHFLPEDIAGQYQSCDDLEIRAQSFGVLTASRLDKTADWHSHKGSFSDQGIFGPVKDYFCACGKYFGRDSAGIICDICGVKVTSTDARSIRCAHLKLPSPITHPMSAKPLSLTVWPVLPVAYIEAPGGAKLLHAYDAILRGESADDVKKAVENILTLLAPLLIAAHNCNWPQRLMVAHGMALQAAEG